jgi:DNA-binding LacI/PurR family transcriptional regulator
MVATMAEIAELAGVSLGTVSRVVNGKDKVHPRTRTRIQALIDQVGYQPSITAQSLASRRTNNIMLIIPNITDTYYPIFVRNITHLLREGDKRLWLGVSDSDPDIEAQYIEQAHGGVVDGLIVSSLQSPRNIPCFTKLTQRDIPVVNMDVECLNLKMNTVKYNDLGGGRRALNHLLKKGYSRSAFCAGSIHLQTVADRFQGYKATLTENGIAVDDALCLTADSGIENWPWDNLKKLMQSDAPPTAVFAENDIMAMACIQFLYRCGLRVPEDIAVIGFGHTYLTYKVEKPLTTIEVPLDTACKTAVDMLLSLIGKSSEEQGLPQIKILEPKLIVGATT